MELEIVQKPCPASHVQSHAQSHVQKSRSKDMNERIRIRPTNSWFRKSATAVLLQTKAGQGRAAGCAVLCGVVMGHYSVCLRTGDSQSAKYGEVGEGR